MAKQMLCGASWIVSWIMPLVRISHTVPRFPSLKQHLKDHLVIFLYSPLTTYWSVPLKDKSIHLILVSIHPKQAAMCIGTRAIILLHAVKWASCPVSMYTRHEHHNPTSTERPPHPPIHLRVLHQWVFGQLKRKPSESPVIHRDLFVIYASLHTHTHTHHPCLKMIYSHCIIMQPCVWQLE